MGTAKFRFKISRINNERGATELLIAVGLMTVALLGVIHFLPLLTQQGKTAALKVKRFDLKQNADIIQMALNDPKTCRAILKGESTNNIEKKLIKDGLEFRSPDGTSQGYVIEPGGKMGDQQVTRMEIDGPHQTINWRMVKYPSLSAAPYYGPSCGWHTTGASKADLTFYAESSTLGTQVIKVPMWLKVKDNHKILNCFSTSLVSASPRVTLEESACKTMNLNDPNGYSECLQRISHMVADENLNPYEVLPEPQPAPSPWEMEAADDLGLCPDWCPPDPNVQPDPKAAPKYCGMPPDWKEP